MIRTLAVIGTGLIGTSIALAATRQGVTVYLSDRDETHARQAAALGAGRLERPPEPVDLAVVAVPPSDVGAVVSQEQSRRTAISYTDVAAVKHGAETEILAGAPEPFRYLGGHPLAGAELSGPLAGRPDMFQDRTWILTPSAATGRAALEHGLQLVAICGAAPVLMDSRAHDQRIALTSHLPHVVASLTAARLLGCPEAVPAMVGRGFLDTTRIARGGTLLWSDILSANAAPIAAVLADLQEDLARLLAALQGLAAGDRHPEGLGIVVDLLERGIAGLAEIPDAGPDADALWVAAMAAQQGFGPSRSEPQPRGQLGDAPSLRP